MQNLLRKITKNLVIQQMFHIINPLYWKLLTEIKQKIIKHCKYTNIKIVFSPFKVVDLFIIKESVPKCHTGCFEIIGSATSSYRLKLANVIHIT